MNRVGEFALKGMLAGALLGAGLALLTFNPLFIIGAAISWAIAGGAIGAIMGALTRPEEKRVQSASDQPAAHACNVQPQCVEPQMAQSQCAEKDSNHYQDMVCTSRVTEIPEQVQQH